MPPKAVVENDIETVTFLLAGVRISISARPAAADSQGSVSGFEVVSSAASEASAPDQSPVAPSAAVDALALEATSALAFAALPVPQVDLLERQLRGSHSTWTSRARLGRAFRAGVAARERLLGRECAIASPTIPFQNSIYIVLRCNSYPQGFWTSSNRAYIEVVGDRRGLQPGSIRHALPSRAEATAFLAGAARPWPEEVQ